MNQKILQIRQILVVLILIFSATAFVSCEKYDWVKPKIDPNISVSFKNEITPIFSTAYGPEGKSCIECHKTSLDFHQEKLYETLNNGLINKDNPESSEIMLKLYGSHNARCSDENKQKILNWITQGAINDNVSK